jgi:hypothetical protein
MRGYGAMLVDTVTRGKRVRRVGRHTALRFECHDCKEFLIRQQPGLPRKDRDKT